MSPKTYEATADFNHQKEKRCLLSDAYKCIPRITVCIALFKRSCILILLIIRTTLSRKTKTTRDQFILSIFFCSVFLRPILSPSLSY